MIFKFDELMNLFIYLFKLSIAALNASIIIPLYVKGEERG